MQMSEQMKPQSAYGVPATSVAGVIEHKVSDPLAPYEQDQLNRLINQFKATPVRIQAAFFRSLMN